MAKEPIIHFLKPAEGRTVLCPDGTDWPAEGERVVETRFVRRRLRDKDLVPAEPPAEPDTGPAPTEPAPTEPTPDPDQEMAPASSAGQASTAGKTRRKTKGE